MPSPRRPIVFVFLLCHVARMNYQFVLQLRSEVVLCLSKSSAYCILLLVLSATATKAQTEWGRCIPDRKGNPSALVLAVESGDLSALKRLLASGARVDELHYEGETALLVAARDGKNEMARTLLEADANPSKQTSLGWTALMWAAQKGRGETIKILLAAGADVNARNKEGATALLWAARDGGVAAV